MHINFVRRLDDLGRIVIPKEIRQKLNFNNGDLLDLNLGNESLIIKKNNTSLNKEYVKEFINLLDYLSNYEIILTDVDKVIAKSKNSLCIEEIISDELKKLILEHKSCNFINGVLITKNYFLNGNVFAKILIKESNTLGLLIIKSDDKEDINFLINIVAKLILQ